MSGTVLSGHEMKSLKLKSREMSNVKIFWRIFAVIVSGCESAEMIWRRCE